MERTGLIQFAGKDAPVLGADIEVGQTAPEFFAHTLSMEDQRILRRAVFVVNRADKVFNAAYMPALGVEPDYEAVLAAAQAAL